MSDHNFDRLVEKANGQQVYLNAWGGDDKINAYIKWVSDRVNADYGITLEHVKLNDTAVAVSRILAEKTAGRDTDGSVDMLWVNGENFASMMRADLLRPNDWVTSLPNWRYTDANELPAIMLDFAVPTKGREVPWGRAQLVFFHDSAYLANPPKSANALKAYISKNPGRFTYPQPPDFIGVSFLKQLLIELTDANDALYAPVDEADFDAVTAPLWQYLEDINPNLWRGGNAYPQNYPAMRELVADGELDIYIAFNPADASSAIASGELHQILCALMFMIKAHWQMYISLPSPLIVMRVKPHALLLISCFHQKHNYAKQTQRFGAIHLCYLWANYHHLIKRPLMPCQRVLPHSHQLIWQRHWQNHIRHGCQC